MSTIPVKKDKRRSITGPTPVDVAAANNILVKWFVEAIEEEQIQVEKLAAEGDQEEPNKT